MSNSVASKVSAASKICVVFVLLGDVLLTGIIFGWTSIKQVLVNETQYAELCKVLNETKSETFKADYNNWTTGDADAAESSLCPEQATELSLIFTVGSTVLSFGSLPVGFFLDSAGPVAVNVTGAVAIVAGLLAFAFAESSAFGWLFSLSYGLLGLGSWIFCAALPLCYSVHPSTVCPAPSCKTDSVVRVGGCLTMLASFPAAFLWPAAQSGILAAISCLFDASSVVFAVMAQLYFQDPQTFSRLNMFAVYTVRSCGLGRLGALLVVSATFSSTVVCFFALSVCLFAGHGLVQGIAALLLVGIVCSWARVNKEKKLEAAHPPLQQDSGDEKNEESIARASGPPKLNEQTLGEQLKSYEYTVILLFRYDRIRWKHAATTHALAFLRPERSPHMCSWVSAYAGVQRFISFSGCACASSSIHMLRCNYFIDTVDELLFAYDGPDYEFYETGTAIFSFVLPGGIIFIPIISWTVKRWGTVNNMQITNALGVLVGILSLVPSAKAQIATFAAFAAFRAYLYGVIATFIAEKFGLVSTLGHMHCLSCCDSASPRSNDTPQFSPCPAAFRQTCIRQRWGASRERSSPLQVSLTCCRYFLFCSFFAWFCPVCVCLT